LLLQGQDVKMANELPRPDALRYLDADHVEHRSGTLAGITVCSQDDQKLGSISGVLVEPTSRRVRYFIVQRGGLLPRRYMLAADSPAVLEANDQKLRILTNLEDLERFETQHVEPFSEEDAITAMFSHPAA
jgi:PRC-barrel domain protein